MLRPARLVTCFILLGLFACHHDVEFEGVISKLVENDGECPSEDAVADEGNYDDVERTDARTIERPTLCYYRFEAPDEDREFYCTYERTTLSALRTSARDKRFVPSAGHLSMSEGYETYACDEGRQLVVLFATKDAVCPDVTTLEGASGPRKGHELQELIATDTLTPYRYCEYRVSGERPAGSGGGCGGNGTMFTGM